MIFRNSLILAFFSFLSLVLGLVRDRLLSEFVGVSHALDLYNAAFRIPDLLYGALLAFISAGTVVPYLTKEDKSGKEINPLHRLISLGSLFITINIIIGVVLFVMLPFIAQYVVPGFSQAEVREYVYLARILMIQPILLGLASLFSCYAQLRNEFVLFGVSPLLYTLGIICGTVFWYKDYGVEGLIYGVLMGGVLSLTLQSFSLRSLRRHHFKHLFSWYLTKEAIRLALPRTGTNIVTQLRVIAFHGFATTLGPGFLSAYLFALRVTESVVQVVQQSLTTASIPVLSKAYTEGHVDTFRSLVRKYTGMLGLLGIGIGLFLALLSSHIVTLLYGQGSMNALILFFLFGALIALPFQMVNGYLSVSFYSLRDTKSVFLSYLISSITVVLFLFSGAVDGAKALLAANTLFWIMSALLLLVFYSRKRI